MANVKYGHLEPVRFVGAVHGQDCSKATSKLYSLGACEGESC
jgi:hypothetical protein